MATRAELTGIIGFDAPGVTAGDYIEISGSGKQDGVYVVAGVTSGTVLQTKKLSWTLKMLLRILSWNPCNNVAHLYGYDR